MSVQDIFDPLKPVSSPAEWKAYQTMGANSDAAEVASMLVKTIDAKDNPGTLLNSPLELCVAREILAYSLSPFLQQHRQVRPKALDLSL
jgi:hypothetical protein